MTAKLPFWDILSRRDPHGYFVIPIKPEGREIVESIIRQNNELYAKIIEGQDVVLVRVKSRSVAEKILRAAIKRDLVAEMEEVY